MPLAEATAPTRGPLRPAEPNAPLRLKPLEDQPAVDPEDEALEELELLDFDEDPRAREVPPWRALLDAISSWIDRLLRSERPSLSLSLRDLARPRDAWTAEAGPAPPPRPKLEPPPSLESLPAIRLKPLDEDIEAESQEGGGDGRWLKGLLVAAGVVGVALVATALLWMPRSKAPSLDLSVAQPQVAPGADAPSPAQIQTAVAQLPHLAPATTRLVMFSSPSRFHAPAGVFQRAMAAARRGSSALTPDEAEQLRVLEAAVLVPLPPADRARMLAYQRKVGERDSVTPEDARMLELFARGVYGLDRLSRLRLQVMLAKAVAAGLAR
jgi:hypothetical protein